MCSLCVCTSVRTLRTLLLASVLIVINTEDVFALIAHKLVAPPKLITLVADHYQSLANNSSAEKVDHYSSLSEHNSTVVIVKNFNEKLLKNLGDLDSRMSTDLSVISQQIIMLLVVKILLL